PVRHHRALHSFPTRRSSDLEERVVSRVYNFSAGPAVLPEEVLKEAAEEMLDYRGCGMSVMEMSHRSKMFENIIQEAESDLRDLLDRKSTRLNSSHVSISYAV